MPIVNLFIAARRSFADWLRRERAYAELMALSDRALADIGIRRSQIRALVEGDDVRDGETQPARLPEASDFWAAQSRLIGLSTKPNS
jgi:uncharacterized protein YjiS (DUF1127 family)